MSANPSSEALCETCGRESRLSMVSPPSDLCDLRYEISKAEHYRLGYERQRAEVARLQDLVERCDRFFGDACDFGLLDGKHEYSLWLATRAALAAPTVAKAGTARLCAVCQRGEHEKHYNQPPGQGYCECPHPSHAPAPTAPAEAPKLEWAPNGSSKTLWVAKTGVDTHIAASTLVDGERPFTALGVHRTTEAAAKAEAERIAVAAGLLPPPAASKEDGR